jgi:ATP-dependent DNA helicase DinG
VAPEERGYTRQVIEKIIPLLSKLNGRALLLFTSHRALQEAAVLLNNTGLAKEGGYSLFVQGENDNYQLIEAFKRSPQGVLLGTGSFWEGLDLSGAQLSCVLIDKLPFASPADPLIKLRTDYLNRYGVDSFQDYMLPEAVIKLRQGCGRLLRRREDKGILILADPRLQTKAYGQVFLDSLPAMKKENTLEPVLAFLSNTEDENYETTGH